MPANKSVGELRKMCRQQKIKRCIGSHYVKKNEILDLLEEKIRDQMSVPELKKECSGRGMKGCSKLRKDELLARLRAWDKLEEMMDEDEKLIKQAIKKKSIPKLFTLKNKMISSYDVDIKPIQQWRKRMINKLNRALKSI